MSGNFTVTVSSEGVTVNMIYSLLSVEANHQINKISYAKLTYIEEDGYQGKVSLTKDKAFTPGKFVKINLRYDEDSSNEKTIFEGVIVKHQIKFNNHCASLILELRHTAVNLTISRKNSIFSDKSDKEIFDEIGKNYSGMKFISNVKPEPVKHRQMIQSWCSDWDFILSRAECNGWWLINGADNQLQLITPPNFTELPAPNITLDLNAKSIIYTLDMVIDILHQVDKVSAASWDVDKQEVLNKELFIKQKIEFKNFESDNNYALYHCGDLNQQDLQTWVHSKEIKNNFSLFKGKIKILGKLDIEPGMIITLNNLGPYFSRRHVVSSVQHIVNKNGFQTEIGIGVSIDSLISMQTVDSPPAGGMLPSIKGLHIGVVKGYDEINNNEKNQLLVKVILPLFGKKDNEVWARLTSVYAGSEYGVVFRPEVDDEVVLGFFNDDPRYPVILGSMYSAKNKPPIQFNKENDQKAIVTKGKMTILLDDKIESIELVTSKESKLTMATKGDMPGISLKDINENSLIFNIDGINCSSKVNTKINSEEDVIIHARKIEVK